ncbi:hypothetical protein [Pseudomonas faucium]|uniref:hypothetical protein n=1 Tax=Pseudomonas faucium TaxID=2740518 RepID=UPI0039C4B095
MKVSDYDAGELINAISSAISPVIFRGVGKDTPAHVMRDRMKVSAEIMGRITAVLHCGDEVGPDILERIERSIEHFKVAYEGSLSETLGPGGSLSKPPEI